MRGVMRMASQQSISYAALVIMVIMQMVTGAVMGLKPVRTGSFARTLEAVSGWYLAVFLLVHVFAPLPIRRPAGMPAVAAALTPPDLLASAAATAQLPYYLLGVAAFLFHVGIYVRLAALAWLTESSVRRLSYAGAFVGVMVMVTVGLSLCGIHVLR
jgi:succinate dehydrogenase/fumarate reductase cytochrome b subunit